MKGSLGRISFICGRLRRRGPMSHLSNRLLDKFRGATTSEFSTT